MTEEYNHCRQLDIFDFLSGNEVGEEFISVSSSGKLKKSKAKAPKSSKAEKYSGEVAEYLRGGTPFENPPPKISYPDKYFCLTGKFGFGPQVRVSRIISSLGGNVQKNVTDRTNYLVVGERANKSWTHKSYGLKIRKAASRKLKGLEIVLVKEEDLTATFPEKMNPSRRQMRFEDYGVVHR